MPPVLYLRGSQNLAPLSKNAEVPDLISEGQEVVVDPKTVHANPKQLGGVAHELTLDPAPH